MLQQDVNKVSFIRQKLKKKHSILDEDLLLLKNSICFYHYDSYDLDKNFYRKPELSYIYLLISVLASENQV